MAVAGVHYQVHIGPLSGNGVEPESESYRTREKAQEDFLKAVEFFFGHGGRTITLREVEDGVATTLARAEVY